MQELIEKIKREQVSFKEESTIIDGNKEYVKGVLKWLETALVFISQLKQKAKQKTLLKQSSSRVVVKQVIKKVVKEVPIHYVLNVESFIAGYLRMVSSYTKNESHLWPILRKKALNTLYTKNLSKQKGSDTSQLYFK